MRDTVKYMVAWSVLEKDEVCKICGLELWETIASSKYFKLGLYNDDRFPGRCILASQEHYNSFDILPKETAFNFMQDIQAAMKAVKKVTGSTRVNVAILGNREPHLHAHLIPRFPEQEEFPDCSPWNDRRTKGRLSVEQVKLIKRAILEAL